MFGISLATVCCLKELIPMSALNYVTGNLYTTTQVSAKS